MVIKLSCEKVSIILVSWMTTITSESHTTVKAQWEQTRLQESVPTPTLTCKRAAQCTQGQPHSVNRIRKT